MQRRSGHLKIRDTNSFKEYERSLRSFSRLKSCMERGHLGLRTVECSEWAHTSEYSLLRKTSGLVQPGIAVARRTCKDGAVSVASRLE